MPVKTQKKKQPNVVITRRRAHKVKPEVIIHKRRERDITGPIDFNEGFYPDIDDPDFEQKIYNKREFRELTLPVDYLDTPAIQETCNPEVASFTLSNVQRFVSRFLSPATPFNSAILYHGVGVGKTCSAVSVAEAFLAEDGGAKRVHIIVPKHVEDNFRKTVFNTMWLTDPVIGSIETAKARQCTGDTYIALAAARGDEAATPEKLASLIDRMVKRRYIFYSYQKFSNTIKNWQREANTKLRSADRDPMTGEILSDERREELMNEEVRIRINDMFSGSVIIIDEAHNLRITGDTGTAEEAVINNEDSGDTEKDEDTETVVDAPVKPLTAAERKRVTEALKTVLRNSSGAKLLLLTATPMFNESKEIITLLNLLRLNDKRPEIRESDIFNHAGNLTDEGRARLRRAIRGYISYMRGENPVTFPVRLYPNDATTFENIPTHDAMGRELSIHRGEPIVPTHLTEVTGDQLEIMKIVQEALLGGRESGGIPFTIADVAIQCSSIVFPKVSDFRNDSNNNVENVENVENVIEENIINTNNLDINMDEINNVPITPKIRSAASLDPEVRQRFGMTGFRSYFREQRDTARGKGLEAAKQLGIVNAVPPVQYKFRYETTESVRRLLLPSYGGELTNYSSKMADILESISTGEGISLVASRWLPIGALMMAFLLELHGYERFVPGPRGVMEPGSNHNLLILTPEMRNFLADSGITRRCALCDNRPDSHPDVGHDFVQARYILLSGDKEISPAFNESVKSAKSDANANGSIIKVILGVRVVEEGLDFRFIRQVHIMEPWFHLNRAEQIIGRGVRQCSHALLPPEKRNTMIYLHSTAYPAEDDEEWGWRETVDLYVYRLALSKAQRIGEVSRILKESAVDCELNFAGNHFPPRDELYAIDSHGIEHTITQMDRPGTSVCDYLTDCNYKCVPHIDRSMEEDTSTYGIIVAREIVREVQNEIRDLFKSQEVFSAPQLRRLIVDEQGIPLHIFYEALFEMVDNPKMKVVHGLEGPDVPVAMRAVEGYIVRRGLFYAFQPRDITDVKIPWIQRMRASDRHAETYMLGRVELPENETQNQEDAVNVEPAMIGYANFVNGPAERLRAFWDMFNDVMANPADYAAIVAYKPRGKAKPPAAPEIYNTWREIALSHTDDDGNVFIGDIPNQAVGEIESYPALAYYMSVIMKPKDTVLDIIGSLMECIFDTVFTWREKRLMYIEHLESGPHKDKTYELVLRRLFADVELIIPSARGQNKFFWAPTQAIPADLETRAKAKRVVKQQRGKERPPREEELREFNEDLAQQGMEGFAVDKIEGTTLEESNTSNLRLYLRIQEWISEKLSKLSENGADVFGANQLAKDDGHVAFVRCHLFHMREPDKTTNITEQLSFIAAFLDSAQGLIEGNKCTPGATGEWKTVLSRVTKYVADCRDDTPVEPPAKKGSKKPKSDKKITTAGEVKRKELQLSKFAWCRLFEVLLRCAQQQGFCGHTWFIRPTEYHVMYGPIVLWRALHL